MTGSYKYIYTNILKWILILIGVDGAEREVFSCRLTLGEDIEECGFSNVGDADDAYTKIGADASDEGLLLRFYHLLRGHVCNHECDMSEAAII